ncbi:MAG: FHA domain-containing protein [Verrucomicrobia bacterium]|nr:FHA domain-containing protein [Verrucomicrobiota bacterium]
MPKLVALSQEMAGRESSFDAPTVTVGRAPDNTICIEDGSVSSHHAELVREGEAGDYLLRDLHSTNGTRVNGQSITEQKLSGGDTVRFGRVDYRYEGVVQRGSKPLPDIKQGIDLGEGRQRPSSVFQNVSPFRKQKVDKSARYLQWAVVILALLALTAFLALAYKYYTQTQM